MIVILTSDIDPLCTSRPSGVRARPFRGSTSLAKTDFKDADAFIQRIKAGTCGVVASKNSRMLRTLIENFTGGAMQGIDVPDHRRRGRSGEPQHTGELRGRRHAQRGQRTRR